MSELPTFLKSGEAARLIPTVADTSKEGRAVSILLASMMAVRPFTEELLSSLGQRIGKRSEIECYREIVFQTSIKGDRPDGLIICRSGKKEWRALVEGKIARAKIDADQIQRYAEIARSNNIDAVITISNELAALPTHGPTQLPKTLSKHVKLYHWSWISILTQAQLVFANSDFEDEHEHFILSELIRFLAHPSTGISSYDTMAPAWKELCGKIQAGAPIVRNSEVVSDAVASWHQEEKDLCLLLSRELASPVQIKMSRTQREDRLARLNDDADALCDTFRLISTFDTPNTAAPLEVTCDFRRRSVMCSMKLRAPEDKKRNTAKINWLLRQLSHTSDDRIFIRATWPRRANDTYEKLIDIRENPSILEVGHEEQSLISFEVTMIESLTGSFSSPRKFIQIVEAFVPAFYRDVGEHLRAWIPPPPKMREPESGAPDPTPNGDSANPTQVASEEEAPTASTGTPKQADRSVFVSEAPWHWLRRNN